MITTRAPDGANKIRQIVWCWSKSKERKRLVGWWPRQPRAIPDWILLCTSESDETQNIDKTDFFLSTMRAIKHQRNLQRYRLKKLNFHLKANLRNTMQRLLQWWCILYNIHCILYFICYTTQQLPRLESVHIGQLCIVLASPECVCATHLSPFSQPEPGLQCKNVRM